MSEMLFFKDEAEYDSSKNTIDERTRGKIRALGSFTIRRWA